MDEANLEDRFVAFQARLTLHRELFGSCTQQTVLLLQLHVKLYATLLFFYATQSVLDPGARQVAGSIYPHG